MISPVMALIVVAIIYGLIRTFVLRSPNSFKRAFYVRPCLTPACYSCFLNRCLKDFLSQCGNACAMLCFWTTTIKDT